MNLETASALNQVYVVFAHYKDPRDFAKQSGISRSLGSLTREDWEEMHKNFDMEVEIYDATVFRHFLPRLLDWFSEDFPSHWFELGVVTGHLRRLRWHQWPLEEVEALRAFFAAWAHQALERYDGEFPLEILLRIEDDLSPYLEIWLVARPRELARWLWTVDWENQENVRIWVTSPRVEAALEAEFFRHPDGEDGRLISRTIELLRSLRG